MNQSVIPFGKYKGQEIETVKARDPAYIQWLIDQAWFVEKFAPIHQQIVVNNFSPPSEDTPAHNAIQVKFLDFKYRAALWLVLLDDLKDRIEMELTHNHKFFRKIIPCREEKKKIRAGNSDWSAKTWYDFHRKFIKKRWDIRQKRRSLSLSLKPFIISVFSNPAFETSLSDVEFSVDMMLGFEDELTSKEWSGDKIFEASQDPYSVTSKSILCSIEIKPSMGDDFPSVLRQMKRQLQNIKNVRSFVRVLLIDEFGSSSVTFDEVKQIFLNDKIRIVAVSQIREKIISIKEMEERIGVKPHAIYQEV